MQILLASGSQYRKSQLQQLKLAFQTEAPDIDESPEPNENPLALASRLARGKARVLASKYPDTIIIAADQTAECRGKLLGKPGNSENARQQLEWCQSHEAVFHSALCVLNNSNGEQLEHITDTRVQFRALSPRQIDNYIKLEPAFDCAGSFKSEGLGCALFKSIQSEDPSALIGLPMLALVEALIALGIDPLSPRDGQ